MKNIRCAIHRCAYGKERVPAKDLPAKILWEEEAQRSKVVGFETKPTQSEVCGDEVTYG